ncbi:MAG: phage terminase small subunit P27 family [Bacteroidales bacterium]|nr:phage terminase small subunit P27 family [Bacteroidales bacterium]MDT8402793.1 phage terminase small subunit P27 family [Bacteroidales bacterium]
MTNNSYKKPAFLSTKARKYWDFLTKQLESIEAFHEIDTLQLGILCNALNDYEQATKQLDKEGRTYLKGGMIRLHPANQIQADSLKTIKEIGAGFGLNFRSRESLLKVFMPKKEKDEFDRLI